MKLNLKDGSTVNVTVLDPTFPEAKTISKEDVWGEWSEDHRTKIHDGMIVATCKTGENICPVWGDIVGYKSVTVVAPSAVREEVAYWLEYVHGCDCIAKVKELSGERVAFRSDYMAW